MNVPAPFRKILVATDFSPGAQLALDKALEVRRSSGATLTLIHVFQLPIPYGDVYVSSPQLIADLESAVHTEMDALLDATKKRAQELDPDGASTISGVVVTGDPVHSVIALAKRDGFDLLVVGTHGRTGLAHLFIGSVAERIVRTAPCPVLTVRALHK